LSRSKRLHRRVGKETRERSPSASAPDHPAVDAPDELPEMIALPVADGRPDYLDRLRASTRPD
jgi:uncharacterized protein involved in tolerance to divalent cations